MEKPHAMVFIDMENLFWHEKELHSRIELEARYRTRLELINRFINKHWRTGGLRRGYYHQYVRISRSGDEEYAFPTDLVEFTRSQGFRTINTNSRIADTDLAVEMVAWSFNPRATEVILVLGDRDYLWAVHYVKQLLKPVTIIFFHSATDGELKRTVNRFVSIDELTFEEQAKPQTWRAFVRRLARLEANFEEAGSYFNSSMFDVALEPLFSGREDLRRYMIRRAREDGILEQLKQAPSSSDGTNAYRLNRAHQLVAKTLKIDCEK